MKETHREAKLQEAADYYLQQLRAGDFEAAFHGLIDFDKAIVHHLIAAFRAEKQPTFGDELLRIILEFRTPFALPLLEEALRDRRDTRWRLALDGLVMLASAGAVATLEAALRHQTAATHANPDYIEWVREALEQARNAADATRENA